MKTGSLSDLIFDTTPKTNIDCLQYYIDHRDGDGFPLIKISDSTHCARGYPRMVDGANWFPTTVENGDVMNTETVQSFRNLTLPQLHGTIPQIQSGLR